MITRKVKLKPLRAVGRYTLKPDVQPLDFDVIEFHSPGGERRFEIHINGDGIEIRSEYSMKVRPRLANSIFVECEDGLGRER